MEAVGYIIIPLSLFLPLSLSLLHKLIIIWTLLHTIKIEGHRHLYPFVLGGFHANSVVQWLFFIHLSARPSVRLWEREVTGSHSTCTENLLFLWIARVWRYTKKPTETTSNGASSGLKEALCNSAGQKYDRARSKLTYCGLETAANERDSGVEVVRRCLTEGGDSILRIFSWELLKLKLQDNQRVS